MATAANSLEGGTNGVAVSAGNSGGLSGTAFDSVTIGTGATLAYDNAHAAHGALAMKVATSGTTAQSFSTWSTAIGSQSQVWFRFYLYITAMPAVNTRIWAGLQNATTCGAVRLSTGAAMVLTNAAGSTMGTSSSVVPNNTWVRLEGFLIGSATVGQMELRYFATADSTVPTEVLTTSAVNNTTGSPNTYDFGFSASAAANIGPYWIDDMGMSSVGYMGPVAAGGFFAVTA